MRWIVVAGAVACATPATSDSAPADPPATCADLHPDPTPCESVGIEVAARFATPDGVALGGEVPGTTPFRVEARLTNPGTIDQTVRSPDCILKEWGLFGSAINLNGFADCFAPTERIVPAGETVGIPSTDLDGSDLGAGPLRATLTLWMLDATDTLQVCSVCAEGLTLTK